MIENSYTTNDLCLASFLALFFPIEAIDKRDSSKVSFHFIRTEKFDELLEAFWKRKVQVNPQDYFSSIKNVKSRIYQE